MKALLVAAALGACAAWFVQDWRITNAENHRLENARNEERELSRMESKRIAEVVAAQNAARLRESKLRMDAVAAKSAADSLRRALAVQAAGADPATCPDVAASQAVVLSDCAARYSGLAEIADRHASDIQTLTDAWPKK